jgi:hypothetical protein
MTQTMRQLSDVLPLTRVVAAIQEPWLGTGSNVSELVWLSALFAVAVALAAWKHTEAATGLALLRRRPA